MSAPGTPEDIPPLLDQDEAPYGTWRVNTENSHPSQGIGFMVWEPAPENTEGRMRPLLDQPHETGSWWAGSGCSMRWNPGAPAPNPIPEMVPESEENA